MDSNPAGQKLAELNHLAMSALYFPQCPTAPVLFVFSHYSISVACYLDRSQGNNKSIF